VDRSKKRVVIADGSPLIVEAIAKVLKDEGSVELIGTAPPGAPIAPLMALVVFSS
jgi:chemotaxis response regulator CheB